MSILESYPELSSAKNQQKREKFASDAKKVKSIKVIGNGTVMSDYNISKTSSARIKRNAKRFFKAQSRG